MTYRRGFMYADVLCTLAVIGLMYALVMGYATRAVTHTRTAACAHNMHEIGVALRAYALDYGGAFPAQQCGLEALWDKYAADKGILVCPQVEVLAKTQKDDVPPSRVAGRTDLLVDYVYRGGLYGDDLPSLPVAMDYLARQHQGGANVLYLDGHVQWRAFPETHIFSRQMLTSGALDGTPPLRGDKP